MRRIVQEATLLATVVLLALAIWFVIADTENREIEERLGFSIAVGVRNLASDLAVASEPLPVTLTVIGRRADLDGAGPDDFLATVDLSGRPAGRHNLPVRVESLDDQVRVRAIQPETAVVFLEEVVERQVVIVIETANPPPLGFRVGTPRARPEMATVSGIAEEVDAVEVVVARIDLGGATAAIERDVALEARTGAGIAVGRVTVSPRFAVVEVPVEQELFRRSVSVRPQVVGIPQEGYRVRVVRVVPPTVDVLVSVDEFDEEAVVEAALVDVSGRSSDLITSADLIFSDGVAPGIDANTSVQVIVTIEPVMTTVRLSVPVEPSEVPDGLELAEFAVSEVRLVLHGPVALIAEIEGPLTPISVDLSQLGPGRHNVELEWAPPAGIELVEMSPVRTIVALVQATPPPPEPEPESGEDGDDTDQPVQTESSDPEAEEVADERR